MSNDHSLKALKRAVIILDSLESMVLVAPGQETFEVGFIDWCKKHPELSDWLSLQAAGKVINDSGSKSTSINFTDETVLEDQIIGSVVPSGSWVSVNRKTIVFHAEDISELRRLRTSLVTRLDTIKSDDLFVISMNGKLLKVRLTHGSPENVCEFREAGNPYKVIKMLYENGPVKTQDLANQFNVTSRQIRSITQVIRDSVKKNLFLEDGSTFLNHVGEKYQLENITQ